MTQVSLHPDTQDRYVIVWVSETPHPSHHQQTRRHRAQVSGAVLGWRPGRATSQRPVKFYPAVTVGTRLVPGRENYHLLRYLALTQHCNTQPSPAVCSTAGPFLFYCIKIGFKMKERKSRPEVPGKIPAGVLKAKYDESALSPHNAGIRCLPVVTANLPPPPQYDEPR